MTDAAVVILAANRDIVVGFLDMVSTVVQGAADAFGWVPGLGSKLKTAAAAVSDFKDSVSNDFNAAIAKVNGWSSALNNAPKVATLKGDITDLTAKINSAEAELANPDLTATKKAQIEAEHRSTGEPARHR